MTNATNSGAMDIAGWVLTGLFSLFMWGGLWLRSPWLRAVFPLRR